MRFFISDIQLSKCGDDAEKKVHKMISEATGGLSALGDYMSQFHLEQQDLKYKDRKWDRFRMAKMTILGLTFFGPHALVYY